MAKASKERQMRESARNKAATRTREMESRLAELRKKKTEKEELQQAESALAAARDAQKKSEADFQTALKAPQRGRGGSDQGARRVAAGAEVVAPAFSLLTLRNAAPHARSCGTSTPNR